MAKKKRNQVEEEELEEEEQQLDFNDNDNEIDPEEEYNEEKEEEEEEGDDEDEEPEAISLSIGKTKTIEQLKLERFTKNKAENEKKAWRKQKEENRIQHNQLNKRKRFDEGEEEDIEENQDLDFPTETIEEEKGKKTIFDNLEVVVLPKVGGKKQVENNRHLNNASSFMEKLHSKHKRMSTTLLGSKRSKPPSGTFATLNKR